MPANFTGSLAISGSLLLTGSITTTGGITISGSIASASFASTASFITLAQTASFVTTAQTASFVANAQSASNAVNAITASSADSFLVRNTLTAQTIVVQTITSSVDFVTGSTRFGSISANTHEFTGSVSITGSLTTSIAALGSAASLFLVSDGNVIKSRTAAQTLSDIAALPLAGGTLTGALSGTSATFSGNGAFSGVLQVAPTTGTGMIGVGDNFGGNMNAGIYRGGAGVTTAGNYLNIGGYDGVVITTGNAALGSQTTRLTIASTGAATFSSSVTAGGFGAFTGASNGAPVLTLGTAGAINAVINTADEMFLNIDSDNNQTEARFVFATNRTGSSGGTELVTFKDNGNVGIGTTTPDSRLHVGLANGSQLRINYIASGDNYYDGVTHYFRNSGGSSNIMTLLNGGNVGIGTTSPSYLLTLNSTTSSKLSLTGGTSQNGIRFEAITGVNAFYLFNGTLDSGGFGVYDNTNSAARLWINNSGNVGIGTTNPAVKLDVRTSANTTTLGNSRQLSLWHNGSGIGARAEIGFGYSTGTYQPSIIGSIAVADAGGGAQKDDIYFATRDVTTDVAPTERMRITSGGNLGLGVTPITAGACRRHFQLGYSTCGAIVSLGINACESCNPRVFSNQFDLGFASGISTGNMLFYTNDSERLHITSTGIACFACQVCAGGGFRAMGSNGFIDTDGTRTAGISSNFTGGTPGLGTFTNHDLAFYTNATNERMRITSVGNIGIGATTVRSQVHIQNGNTTGNTAIGTTGKNVTCGGCSILFCFGASEASMTGQLMITGQTAGLAFSAIYDVVSIYEGVCLNRRFCMSRGVGEIINVNAFGTNNYDKMLCISQTNPYNGTMSISATFIGTSSILTYLCAP